MYHCLYIDSIFTWIVTRPCDPDEHFDVIALMLEPLASVGVHSVSHRRRPLFSYIMSLRDVVIYITYL
jgi:hypothetical protein